MSDFERAYNFNELLKKYFSKMESAVEVCTVQDYSFNLSKDEEKKLGTQWRDIAGRAVKEGKEVMQIQLCDTPLTDEMRRYLIKSNAYLRVFGEKFCVIPLRDFQKISEGWDLTKQFWVIDGKTVIITNFTRHGKPINCEESNNEQLSKRAIGLCVKVVSAAQPFDEFIEKYG